MSNSTEYFMGQNRKINHQHRNNCSKMGFQNLPPGVTCPHHGKKCIILRRVRGTWWVPRPGCRTQLMGWCKREKAGLCLLPQASNRNVKRSKDFPKAVHLIDHVSLICLSSSPNLLTAGHWEAVWSTPLLDSVEILLPDRAFLLYPLNSSLSHGG